MAEPRTIDNLGIESSVRWAHDQQFLDKAFLKESPLISRQTTVDVSKPFYTSEFDALFQIKQRYQQWAAFFPPQGYNEQKMRLFTHQIIPSLGSEEFQLAQMQKIRERVASNKNKRLEKQKAGKTGEYGWEDERDEEEENKESNILLALLEYVNMLDKLLIAINSRRNQYSKG